jgi:uncharacterized protein
MIPIEQPVSMHGSEFSMLGIVTLPDQSVAPRSTGLVIVVGGAQSRAGSHRQNVTLARHLARHGFPVLRFDLPGLGDSPGEPVSFENSASCIRTAVDTLLENAPGIQSVCLWGLCDGASASLLYLSRSPDPRVIGLALLNPWVRSEASLARTYVKHYYWRRLVDPSFWSKLASGKVGMSAFVGLARNLVRARVPEREPHSFQERMAYAWHAFSGHVLLMLSDNDLTAQEFEGFAQAHPAWIDWEAHPRLTLRRLLQADHTCSSAGAASAMESGVLGWIQTLHDQRPTA